MIYQKNGAEERCNELDGPEDCGGEQLFFLTIQAKEREQFGCICYFLSAQYINGSAWLNILVIELAPDHWLRTCSDITNSSLFWFVLTSRSSFSDRTQAL